jgi:branched-chain amino acid transport system substrate-binding protein
MKKTFCFLAASLFLLSISGCKSDSDGRLKIGLINPEQGELASYGQEILRGIDIAEEEIKERDLLNGRKVKVLKRNTAGDSDVALRKVKALIGFYGVKYIIGEISSDATETVLNYTKTKGVFLFSPGAATPKLTGASELFARNWPSNKSEAISAAEYSYDVKGYRTAIVVYVNNEWGIGLRENFEKRFAEKGGTIVRTEVYPYTNTDFRPLITKIRNLQADMLYLAGNQKEMGLFMRQYKEYHVEFPIISNTSFLESDCLTLAGNAANGVIVPTPAYDPESTASAKIKSFSERYVKKYGTKPSLVDANGYDALMMIVEAVKEVGDDPYAVAKYIRNLKNYEAAGGIESFVDGDVLIENEFKIVKDGAAVSLE